MRLSANTMLEITKRVKSRNWPSHIPFDYQRGWENAADEFQKEIKKEIRKEKKMANPEEKKGAFCPFQNGMLVLPKQNKLAINPGAQVEIETTMNCFPCPESNASGVGGKLWVEAIKDCTFNAWQYEDEVE